MKSLFVDTNIVIDLLAKRELHYLDAAKLFSLADRGKITLCVSSLSFANANYILTKLKNAKEARTILVKFKVLVTVSNLSDKIVELALNDASFKDFEDGLQYYTAIESNCTIIITRNLKDYRAANIPVMTAAQYLKSRQ